MQYHRRLMNNKFLGDFSMMRSHDYAGVVFALKEQLEAGLIAIARGAIIFHCWVYFLQLSFRIGLEK